MPHGITKGIWTHGFCQVLPSTLAEVLLVFRMLLISGTGAFTLLENQALWALALEDHQGCVQTLLFYCSAKRRAVSGKLLSWNVPIVITINYKPACSVFLPQIWEVKWKNKVLIKTLKHCWFPVLWVPGPLSGRELGLRFPVCSQCVAGTSFRAQLHTHTKNKRCSPPLLPYDSYPSPETRHKQINKKASKRISRKTKKALNQRAFYLKYFVFKMIAKLC